MRHRCVLLCGLLFIAGCARAQIISTPSPVISGAGGPGTIAAPMKTLQVGEELEYQISWWGVPVGTVILSVTPAKEEKGLLKLLCQGRSNAYLEAFYPVRVELISFVDPNSLSPRKFHAYVKRRWRKHESVITFDPIQKTAFHQLPKGKSATVSVSPTTQDGLSLLYYARTLDLRVGQKVPLEVTADGKNWNLTGHIEEVRMVKLKGVGNWPAVQGTVELTYPVPFFHGAKASVWFSLDQNRIPLLAKIHSRIGPVSVVLTKRSKGVSP